MPFDIFFPFKWQNAVDILVISFIVHRLFLLFRGTTAFQVMLAFLFLWVLQSVAQAAGLVLTSWFFQGIGAVAVLISVVVFRNEIREILIQTNPIRFFLGRPYEARTIDVPLIVQTSFRLVQTGTGALIVLQNRDRLGGHLREGLALDGRYSPEIIESIFAKQSPVHDGAAVISGNRIARVGTFLPLTQKEGLPQHFGTRHRAAVGLSEVTDAVVLVVSEERGEISLVHKGQIELTREPEQLREALDRLFLGFTSASKPQSRGRLWLAHAGGLLLTFLLVSTVWGIYSGKQLSLISISAPVDFRNIPEHLELRRASAEKVEVQITGKRRLVRALKPEQVGAFLDLQQINDGVHLVDLNQSGIELPLGLEVVRVTPSTIRLELEKRVEKEVAVEPKLEGSPPVGYRIAGIKLTPESVKVSGAVSVLRTMKGLPTEPITLTEIKPKNGEEIIKVPLVLPPASIRLLEGQSREVQVTVSLMPQAPPSPPPSPKKEKKIRYHQVQVGDTLWGIAQRYQMTVTELRQLNKLAPGVVIHPDQELLLGAATNE
jgi:uncharacterized protein (TIGR00159 family)